MTAPNGPRIFGEPQQNKIWFLFALFEKVQINLAFCSLIRNIDLRSKLLSLKKAPNKFGFLLAYS